MVSTKHYNSQFYFERDVNCIHTFFERRFKYRSNYTLNFKEIERVKDLDNEVKASGFVKKGLGELNVEDLAILDDYEGLLKNL
jgi:RIO kinase 2